MKLSPLFVTFLLQGKPSGVKSPCQSPMVGEPELTLARSFASFSLLGVGHAPAHFLRNLPLGSPNAEQPFCTTDLAAFRLKTFRLPGWTGKESACVPARGCESLEREADGETPPATVWVIREQSILASRGRYAKRPNDRALLSWRKARGPLGVLCLSLTPSLPSFNSVQCHE